MSDPSSPKPYSEQDSDLDTKLGILAPLITGLLIGLAILLLNQ